jgi:mono/diheme cytochrome c family protein
MSRRLTSLIPALLLVIVFARPALRAQDSQATAAKSPSEKSTAKSDEAKPADATNGNVENGKKLFVSYGCYECHGRQGQGGGGAPRIGPPAIPIGSAMRYVRNPTGQMPPYTTKVVPDQDLADIFAFLKSIPQPPRAASIPLLNQ